MWGEGDGYGRNQFIRRPLLRRGLLYVVGRGRHHFGRLMQVLAYPLCFFVILLLQELRILDKHCLVHLHQLDRQREYHERKRPFSSKSNGH